MNTHRPDPLRCAALVLLSLACAAFLIELDSSTPWPSTDPGVFLDWWERHGTAAAAITLLRLVGTTLAGWGIFIGSAGLLAAIRPSGLVQGVWRRITPTSFRQILAASAITVTLAAPTVAGATTQGVEAHIVLEDLGADVVPARFTPVLTDLGPLNPADPLNPVETPSESAPATVTLPNSDTSASRLVNSGEASSPSASDSQQWTVAEGDHLWKIAMKTLRDQGHTDEPAHDDPARIVAYWQRLIDANSEILNGNPDLIHPGMVLTLPPVQPQS